MPKTIELLQKALEIKTVSDWARMFNIVPSTITNARRVGRLSPALAGNLAIELGEDPAAWMLAANLENEKEVMLMDRLRAAKPEWRKRSLSPVRVVYKKLQERRRQRFMNAVNSSLDDGGMAVKYQSQGIKRVHARCPELQNVFFIAH